MMSVEGLKLQGPVKQNETQSTQIQTRGGPPVTRSQEGGGASASDARRPVGTNTANLLPLFPVWEIPVHVGWVRLLIVVQDQLAPLSKKKKKKKV